MKYCLFTLLLTVCIGVATYGRPPDVTDDPEKIRGIVVSFLDKQPLAGVTVVIKGTQRGVITGIDGRFSLEASPADTLVFSYVGYETLEVAIAGQTALSIELTEGIEILQE